MKQKEDKWLKAVRDKMANYSEPVPLNGWESLEKELKEIPLTRRKISPFLRMAVAAVVLLALISSVAIFLLYSPADEYVKHITENEQISTPSVEAIKNDILSKTQDEKTEVTHQLVQANEKEKVTIRKTNPKVTQPLVEKGNEIHKKIEAETTDSVSIHTNKDNEISSSSPKEEPKPQNKPKRTSFPQTGYLAEVSKSKRGPKWSMKLSAGNSFVNVNGTGSGFDAFSESSKASYSKEQFYADASNGLSELSDNRKEILMNTMKEEDEAKTETDYKLPIAFGLSARYAITDKFAIETGIIYTKLSSELRSGNNENYFIEEDDLHYLGIPLKGSWTFLDKKHFSLYVSAGGAFEKSISGKRKTKEVINGEKRDEKKEDLDISKPQWSLSGAVGAQYNVTNHLGIYVEPGVVHYFDDGSDVNTIRKKKPTNFNLQVGLRLSY